jgi:hypothetical protein
MQQKGLILLGEAPGVAGGFNQIRPVSGSQL